MKNILFLLFVSISLIGFSQVTIVDRESSTDYTSDTLVVSISQGNKEYSDYGIVSVYFDLTNSIIQRDIIITRRIINVPSAWSDLICWGTGCYDPLGAEYFTTPLPALTTETDGTTYELKPQINPNDVVGTGHYRYYIVDVNDNNNRIDSVDLIFNFGIANVKSIDKSIKFNVSPNPASNIVSINVDSNSEMDFKIVDVLGNVVLKDVINNSKKVDVSNYNNGLYFITVSSKDRSIVTRKMIVKH